MGGSARKLYEAFTSRLVKKLLAVGVKMGHKWLTKPGRINIDIPGQLAVIGRVSAIEYEAVYDDKGTRARHKFAPGARPILAVGTEPGQVFLIGTNFVFTPRGFVDLDIAGRPISYSEASGRISRLAERLADLGD